MSWQLAGGSAIDAMGIVSKLVTKFFTPTIFRHFCGIGGRVLKGLPPVHFVTTNGEDRVVLLPLMDIRYVPVDNPVIGIFTIPP